MAIVTRYHHALLTVQRRSRVRCQPALARPLSWHELTLVADELAVEEEDPQLLTKRDERARLGAALRAAKPGQTPERSVRPVWAADTWRMADPNELLAEAETTAFRGWDFSKLGDRLVVEPPHWDFAEIVANAAASATTMLDMGTGGGEWLSSLRDRPLLTIATESWQPNVEVAAARLSALSVPVVYTEGAPDNHRQEPGNPAGRLPFRTEAFDLVTNRHESFRADEVARGAAS